jgi:hypothetical protein
MQNIISAGMGSDSCGLVSCSSVNQHAWCCVIFPMLYLHHVSSESCGVVLVSFMWECQKQQEYECWKGNEVSHSMPRCALRHRSRVGKSRAEQHSTSKAEQHRQKYTHWETVWSHLSCWMVLWLCAWCMCYSTSVQIQILKWKD